MTIQTIPPQNAHDVEPPAKPEEQRVEASASSPVGPSTEIDALVHRASMPSNDGSNVPEKQIKEPSEVNRDDPNINVVELPPHSPSFKEQVYGYARLVRGTVLGQPDVKEQGTQVLRGEKSIPMRRGSQ